MNKKNLRKIIILAAVAALLIAAPFAVSRWGYHRSLGASIFSLELRLSGRDSMPDGEEAWLAAKTEENAGTYRIPIDLESTYSKGFFGESEMKYYIFNELSDSDTLIVYFPGGTFIDQPSASHWEFIDLLARDTGAKIIVPIYPKLPSYTAAEAYDILTDFYAQRVQERDYEKLIFMGDSAGGGMALALAEQLAAEGVEGPDRLILISPWLDVSMDNAEMADYETKDPKLDRETLRYAGTLWAGELDTSDPLVSPINGDFSALGDICLYTGSRELLYPDILRFADMLEQDGHEYSLYIGEGMNHIFPLFQCYDIDEAVTAAEDIVQNILR